MTTRRARHTATLLPSGKVLIDGGNADSDFSELFDPVSQTFTALPPSTNRFGHTATLLQNGKVLLAGGWDDGTICNCALNTADLFDPVSQTFTSLPNTMISARYFHIATLLPNGKVLIAGGYTGSPYNTDTAELFDPASQTFTSLPPMTAVRYAHTATPLPSGKVLIAVGYDGTGNVTTNRAELFDPISQTFTGLLPMTSPRYFHTTTLLPSGKVLIAGGGTTDLFNGGTNTAELFDPGLQLVSVVSRKVHGSAGSFDIDLPLTGPRDVECRSGGANGNYTLVFTFANPVTSCGSASTGSLSSGPDPNKCTVNLTGVPNAEYVTVALTGAADSTGAAGNVSGTMGVLVGDVTGNRAVSNTDVGEVKAQVNPTTPITISNFRDDVSCNGFITNTDVGTTKAQVGMTLP